MYEYLYRQILKWSGDRTDQLLLPKYREQLKAGRGFSSYISDSAINIY